jgi:hypothetical protein
MTTHSLGGKNPDVHPVLETLADAAQPGDAVRRSLPMGQAGCRARLHADAVH